MLIKRATLGVGILMLMFALTNSSTSSLKEVVVFLEIILGSILITLSIKND